MSFMTNRFRYLLLIICFCCLTAIAANYIIMHFTFICMETDMADAIEDANGTLISRYIYTPSQKSTVISVVAIGTLIGTPPINYLYIRFGARWPFFIAGCLSILATVISPLAAYEGLHFLLVARFIQGLGYAADFATIGMMCVRWAPLKQTGLFIATLTSFSSVAASITNPLTAALCSSTFGWRSSFYFHAGFGIIMFILWAVLYRDDPQLHPCVSDHELRVIQKGKTKAHIERSKFVPYLEIVKNPVILTVWANAFAEMTSLTLLLTYSPIFFHNVLNYNVCFTENVKMKICNGIAVGGAGVFFLLIGITPPSHADLSVVFVTLVYFCMSLNPGGFYKCATFVSRQYAHFVLSTIQFMKCVALFVAPAIVAFFVKDEHSFEEWKWVFILNGALLIIMNIIFCIIATDRPARFTAIVKQTETVTDIKLDTSM